MTYAHSFLGAILLMTVGCAPTKRASATSSFNYRPYLAGTSFVGRWEGQEIIDGGRFVGQFNADGSKCEGFFYSVTWDRYGKFRGKLVDDQLSIELTHAVKFNGDYLKVKAEGKITGFGQELRCSPVFSYPDGTKNRCQLICSQIETGTAPSHESLRKHENHPVSSALNAYPADESLPWLEGISQ